MDNRMIELDLLDRKILYQLSVDSRQSIRKIAKELETSKSVISYRINRLLTNGLIKTFSTVIDYYKLGYFGLRFLIKYQYTTEEIKKEILRLFITNSESFIVASIDGEYDLLVTMGVKNIHKCYNNWINILQKYRYYFQKIDISIYVKTILLRQKKCVK